MSNKGEFLNFDELRRANVQRCEESFHPLVDWSEMDWLGCVTGELGEVAGLIKQRRRGERVHGVEVGWEIADTVIYLDLLAARMGLDLGEMIRWKFNIVSDRVGSEVKL